jgi:hypothetical protein
LELSRRFDLLSGDFERLDRSLVELAGLGFVFSA